MRRSSKEIRPVIGSCSESRMRSSFPKGQTLLLIPASDQKIRIRSAPPPTKMRARWMATCSPFGGSRLKSEAAIARTSPNGSSLALVVWPATKSACGPSKSARRRRRYWPSNSSNTVSPLVQMNFPVMGSVTPRHRSPARRVWRSSQPMNHKSGLRGEITEGGRTYGRFDSSIVCSALSFASHSPSCPWNITRAWGA